MRIPHAEHAQISPEKLRDYLLNPEHPRGGSKAILLISLGYRRNDWQVLKHDLQTQHLPQPVTSTIVSEYGTRYVISGKITTPSTKSIQFCSIWQIDSGTEVPRLLTMYPE